MAFPPAAEMFLRLLGLLLLFVGLVVIVLSSTTTGALGGAAIVVLGGLVGHWARKAAERHRRAQDGP
jgi:hypothetical protein